MMPVAFRTRRLSGAQLAKAYTLVQLASGDEDAAAWYRFAAAYSSQRLPNCAPCGVVGVEDARGYVLGLFCFRVLRDTPYGALLECDHFVVPDMVRSGLPFAELTLAAEELAREHRCCRIRLAIPGTEHSFDRPGDRYRSALNDAGFTLDSLRYEKRIDAPGASSQPRYSR